MDSFALPVQTMGDVEKYLERTYEVSEEFAREICSRYKESIDLAIKTKLNCYAIGDEIADLEALASKKETDDFFEEVAENDTH